MAIAQLLKQLSITPERKARQWLITRQLLNPHEPRSCAEASGQRTSRMLWSRKLPA